jgi:hypothetical protein
MDLRKVMNRTGIVAGVLVPLILFGPKLDQLGSGEGGFAIVIIVATGLGVWALFRAVGVSIEGLRKK